MIENACVCASSSLYYFNAKSNSYFITYLFCFTCYMCGRKNVRRRGILKTERICVWFYVGQMCVYSCYVKKNGWMEVTENISLQKRAQLNEWKVWKYFFRLFTWTRTQIIFFKKFFMSSRSQKIRFKKSLQQPGQIKKI